MQVLDVSNQSRQKNLFAKPVGAITNTPMDSCVLGHAFCSDAGSGKKGEGFTYKLGDVVQISSPKLGNLTNTVWNSTQCPEWTFGISHLVRNLAKRDLI